MGLVLLVGYCMGNSDALSRELVPASCFYLRSAYSCVLGSSFAPLRASLPRRGAGRFGSPYPRPTVLPCNILFPFEDAMEGSSLSREFAFECGARAIDSCDSIDELRSIAKTLLNAWHLQVDMTRHYGAQSLGIHQPG